MGEHCEEKDYCRAQYLVTLKTGGNLHLHHIKYEMLEAVISICLFVLILYLEYFGHSV